MHEIITNIIQDDEKLKSENFKPVKILFKLENYKVYNKELKKHEIIEGIYQSKVGFVEFNKHFIPELNEKMRNIYDKKHNRNMFGDISLTENINRSNAFFVQGIKQITNL